MGLARRLLGMITTDRNILGPIDVNAAGQITAKAMSPIDFVEGHKKMWSKQAGRENVFKGMVEVDRVANGYLITISHDPQKPSLSYIANSLQEVNDIITAQIVCFKLEGGGD
jgi:hypothetical protein